MEAVLVVDKSEPSGSSGRHLWNAECLRDDSILLPEAVRREIERNGSTWQRRPLCKFVGEVDFFIVTDCEPDDPGGSSAKGFFDLFRPLDPTLIQELRSDALCMYFLPRTTRNSDKPLTVLKDLDAHGQIALRRFMPESIPCNAGIFSFVLQQHRTLL